MKKILITGNRGFIASKLEERLKEKGYGVVGCDLADGCDLLDMDKLEEIIKDVDVVCHVAAQADLTKMVDLGGAYGGVVANVYATNNVAFLCAKYKKWLIYASTMCVYGNLEQLPAREDETLPNPSEIYSCSKYAGEWIIKGYSKNFGNPYTILRFATIYGEGMRPALATHIFFRQAMKGEPITVHGDGSQTRTLTYVHDLVDGVLAAILHENEAKNNVFHLSSPERISAKKMAEDTKRLTGSKSEIVFIEQRKNQTLHEDFDVSKSEELLQWRANTKWDDGLAQTYEYMKSIKDSFM